MKKKLKKKTKETVPQEQRPVNPDKISFSSVKRGTNKHGSPYIGLYMGNDAAAILVRRVQAVTKSSSSGVKLFIQIIAGEKYDSGYAYVDVKQENRNSDKGWQSKRKDASDSGKSNAKKFLNKKRVDSGDEEE